MLQKKQSVLFFRKFEFFKCLCIFISLRNSFSLYSCLFLVIMLLLSEHFCVLLSKVFFCHSLFLDVIYRHFYIFLFAKKSPSLTSTFLNLHAIFHFSHICISFLEFAFYSTIFLLLFMYHYHDGHNFRLIKFYLRFFLYFVFENSSNNVL